MKTLFILFGLGLLTTISAIELKSSFVGLDDDVPINNNLLENNTYTDDIQAPRMRSSTYRRIHVHLKSIQRQIRNEMNSLSRKERINKSSLSNIKNRLASSEKSVKNALSVLNLSRRRYRKAIQMKNKYSHDLRKVHKSIQKQRNYLSQERKLVGYLKREVRNLRHYSNSHKLIVRELNRLEHNIRIQINRLNSHYNRLLRKIRANRTKWINNYNRYNRQRVRNQYNYNNKVSRRNRDRRNYNRALNHLQHTLSRISNQKHLYKHEIAMMNDALQYLKSNRPAHIRSLRKNISSLRNRINHIKRVARNGRLSCARRLRRIRSI